MATMPWARGRTLFRANPHGRKFVLEEWKITQHRGVEFAFLARAYLRRVKPAEKCKGRTVPLGSTLQESEFSATKAGALWKAIVRTEALIDRFMQYRAEDAKEGTDLWKEYSEEITELRHAVTAMQKERKRGS